MEWAQNAKKTIYFVLLFTISRILVNLFGKTDFPG